MSFEVSAQPLTNENVLVAKSRDAIRINHHRGLQLRSSAECWRQAIGRMMNKITVRMAEPSDSRAIADLMGQLGYPTAPSEMQAKVDLFLALPSERFLVAEPEFCEITDRVAITAEPGYLARFMSCANVVGYQRHFMNAAKGMN